MNKRPFCTGALMYILFLSLLLLADTVWAVRLPLTLQESKAAEAVADKDRVRVSGRVYKQEYKQEQCLLYIKDAILAVKSDTIRTGNIIVYTGPETDIPAGNVIAASGAVKKFQKPSNFGQFNSYLYYKTKKIEFALTADSLTIAGGKTDVVKHSLYRLGCRLSESFDASARDMDAGVLKAMVLGDKTDFTGEIKDLYQQAGIMHLAVVSGLHISMAGMWVFNLVRKAGGGYWLAGTAGIICVAAYGCMTGFGVSTCRALIMFIVSMGARITGRRYDLLTAASLAAVLLLLDNPLHLVNSGFLLSFGAVLGIGIAGPALKQAVQSEKWIWKALIPSISVTMFTCPLLLYFYYEFPPYSLILNVIVVPVMSLVFISGFAGCLAGLFSVSAGSFVLGLSAVIVRLYEALCRLTAALPFSSLILGKPSLFRIGVYYMLLLLLLYIAAVKKTKKGFLLLPLMALVLSVKLPEGLRVSVLDVGQGDCIIMETDRGSYMVDGGSTSVKNTGTYRILPYLKARGIAGLRYCFVTHPDEDHISGIRELIEEGYPVQALVMPGVEEKGEGYRELVRLAEEAGIDVLYIEKGDRLKDGLFSVSCLHPYKTYNYTNENDYSTVLDIRYKNFSMLLTGDLEEKGETEVERLLTDSYTVLKVAHHGSKNSTCTSFLEKVKGRYAVISCGENNRYGHPHKETLERLKKAGMTILETKASGAVTFQTDGGRLKIEEYK